MDSMCILNVNEDFGNPAAVTLLDSELMVRNRLHDQVGAVPLRVARLADAYGFNAGVAPIFDPEVAEGDQPAVEPVEHLVQPVDHQAIAVPALDREGVFAARLGRLRIA